MLYLVAPSRFELELQHPKCRVLDRYTMGQLSVVGVYDLEVTTRVGPLCSQGGIRTPNNDYTF